MSGVQNGGRSSRANPFGGVPDSAAPVVTRTRDAQVRLDPHSLQLTLKLPAGSLQGVSAVSIKNTSIKTDVAPERVRPNEDGSVEVSKQLQAADDKLTLSFFDLNGAPIRTIQVAVPQPGPTTSLGALPPELIRTSSSFSDD